MVFTYEFSGATRIPDSVPHPDLKGRSDKSMSLSVGVSHKKVIPDLIILGGEGGLGCT